MGDVRMAFVVPRADLSALSRVGARAHRVGGLRGDHPRHGRGPRPRRGRARSSRRSFAATWAPTTAGCGPSPASVRRWFREAIATWSGSRSTGAAKAERLPSTEPPGAPSYGNPFAMAVVGIDLGTTNTVVACVRSGRVHVLADEQGRRLLPSVVSFHPNGEVLVGHAAKAAARRRRQEHDRERQAPHRPRLGLRRDPARAAALRLRAEGGPRTGAARRRPRAGVHAARDQRVRPQARQADRRDGARRAGRPRGHHRPRELQRAAARRHQGRRAASPGSRSSASSTSRPPPRSPTASAARTRSASPSTTSAAARSTARCSTFRATSSRCSRRAGDTFLGGDDLDLAIAERMAEAFLHAHRYDPRADPQAFERLRAAAEAVKIELSPARADAARASARSASA